MDQRTLRNRAPAEFVGPPFLDAGLVIIVRLWDVFGNLPSSFQGFVHLAERVGRDVVASLSLPEDFRPAGRIDKKSLLLRLIHHPLAVSYTHLTLPTSDLV